MLILRLKVKLYESIQNRRIYRQFPAFKAFDQQLLKGRNPYSVQEAFPYGETPLTTLQQMADRWSLKPEDHFVDLGCGRGRGVLFLAHVYGCKAHGIDRILTFIQQAKTVQHPKVSFSCGDLLRFDFKKATFVYFYGTGFSEEVVQKLSTALQTLPKNSKIVTVSYPLEGFTVQDQFTVSFPWGKADLFLNLKTF